MTLPVKMPVFVRTLFGLALPILSGVLFTLAFPPYEIWPLIFIGWIPVWIAQYRILPSKLSPLAPAVGIAVWLQGYLGPVFAPVGTFMVWLPLIAGGITLLTELSSRTFQQRTGYRWFVLSGILGWAGSEMIRLFLPIAGTWAFIAYPLYRQVWLIQPVSVFGIIGQGMLISLVNAALALGLLHWLDARWQFGADILPVPASLWRKWGLRAATISFAWIGLSLVLLNLPLNTLTIRVAAIQPKASPIINANQGHAELVAQLHERMQAQTREAAAQGAQVIVWPEGGMNWDPQVEDKLDLRGLAIESNAYLAAGYVVEIDETSFRNEATVIDPQGEFLGVFGKDHPVTFGGETSPTRGTYPVYDTPLGRLGTIICYDLDYTNTARKLARQGAQLIAVPSNDWSTIADKHFTHTVFRAVENRVAMIKADGGFDSAIVDPYGRIVELASFPQGGEATVVGDVQLGSGKGTLNTRLGDWAGWLSLAGMLFFAFGSGWLEKQAMKQNA